MTTSEEFKQEIKDLYLPMLKRMQIKEKAHLKMLMDTRNKDFVNMELMHKINAWIEYSTQMVSHLNTRIKEYVDYINEK